MMDIALNPQQEPPRRVSGLMIVVLLHVLIGYALVSGLARKAVALIKKPLEATVIQEVKLPPPPPPPEPVKQIRQQPNPVEPPPFVPKAEVQPAAPVDQPVIAAVVDTPPATPQPIAPPAPVVEKAPAKLDLRVACPRQVAPEVPQRALEEGLSGTVTAVVRIRGGKVVDVQVNGPRVFHKAVRDAVSQYQCVSGDEEVVATQDFVFKVE